MDKSLLCPACGGPNDPAPGASRMACTYCGANLIIPEKLRKAAKPVLTNKPPQNAAVDILQTDAPDILRKAQPIAIKAWNVYAYWTWIRWLLPTCLTFLIVGFIACSLLGLLPFVFDLFR
jgi:hypothetical protein